MKVQVKQTVDPHHCLTISACRAVQITVIITHGVVPKLMPPIYFHGNYTRYKEHNNTI